MEVVVLVVLVMLVLVIAILSNMLPSIGHQLSHAKAKAHSNLVL